MIVFLRFTFDGFVLRVSRSPRFALPFSPSIMALARLERAEHVAASLISFSFLALLSPFLYS